ncbi:MAG: cyclic nucleotide-binding domain-containing protein [Hyphomicrobiales bacterium]
MDYLHSVGQHLIHVGAILYLICFLFRNQIALRMFALAGDVAYTAYYFTAASHPLWEAIIWIIPNMGINIVMIALILRDSKHTSLSDDEISLLQHLPTLRPSQFRSLLRLPKWERPAEPRQITTENQSLDTLYYVLSGTVDVDKAGRHIAVTPPAFIGELAYLRKKPATATVTAGADALIVSWPHEALRKATEKDAELASALALLLNTDLAEKVARA